jgi:putative DNA primase/helicase
MPREPIAAEQPEKPKREPVLQIVEGGKPKREPVRVIPWPAEPFYLNAAAVAGLWTPEPHYHQGWYYEIACPGCGSEDFALRDKFANHPGLIDLACKRTGCKPGLIAKKLGIDVLRLIGNERTEEQKEADLRALNIARGLVSPAKETPTPHLELRSLKSYRREAQEWQWLYRIPKGALTLLAGPTGLGKSTALTDVAARVTTGKKWPDGGVAPVGTVVYIGCEENISTTLGPRFDRCGGDDTRMDLLEGSYVLEHDEDLNLQGSVKRFNLARDLTLVEEHLKAHPGKVRMIIFDPISSYIGAKDSWKDTDVRDVLEPLAKLASEYHIAVVGIIHLNKNSERAALDRLMGSGAFQQVARHVLAVAPHPNVEDRYILWNLKHNLTGSSGHPIVYGFDVQNVDLPTSDGKVQATPVPIIEWYPDDRSVAELDLNQLWQKKRTDDKDSMREVRDFLRTLFPGTVDALTEKEVEKEARAAGISWSKVQRHKHALGYISIKPPKVKDAPWCWVPKRVPNKEDAALRYVERLDATKQKSKRNPV